MISTTTPTTTTTTKTKTKLAQPGRKGKKQWRKNIDISQDEDQLEQLRKEEMAIGYVLLRRGIPRLVTLSCPGSFL